MKKKQIAGAVVSAAIVIVLGVCVRRMPVSSDAEPAAPRGETAAGAAMDETTAEASAVQTEQEKLILNRDEDVKEPILQQIFKDKSHPCWADTAWILDVTGELPKAK